MDSPRVTTTAPSHARTGSDNSEEIPIRPTEGQGSMSTNTGARKINDLTTDLKELTQGVDLKNLDPKNKADVQKAVAKIFENSGIEEKMQEAAIGFLVEKMPGVVVELMRAWSDKDDDSEHTELSAATKIVKLAGQFKDYVIAHPDQFGEITSNIRGMSKDEIAKVLTTALRTAWEKLNENDKVDITDLLKTGSEEKAAVEAVINGLEEFGVLKEKDTQVAGLIVRLLKVVAQYLPNKGIFTLLGSVVLSVIGAIIRNVASLEGALAYLSLYGLAVGFVIGLISDTIKHYAIDKAHKEKSPIEKATALLEPTPVLV